MNRERFSLVSLGCAKNLVDSERIAAKLAQSGYEFAFSDEKVDIVIINTCAFLESARLEAEEVISEYATKKRRGKIKKLIVAGCYPSYDVNTLKEMFSEIDSFVSTNNIDDIVKAVVGSGVFVSRRPTSEETARLPLTLPHYEYLKIADGCNHRCSFCLIPRIKGKLHSLTKEFLIQEAEALASNGVKELIVIAQDITQYGIDIYDGVELIPLLDEISKIRGIEWIRLMYSYPSPYFCELIKYASSNEKIVPYVDMPIQHVSDRILKLMKRGTRKEDIIKAVLALKENGFAIRTSVIVGFPYEQDEDFDELAAFINEYEIDHIGIFIYSNERGTASYGFPQVDDRVKKKRFEKLAQIRDKTEKRRISRLSGKVVPAIVDYFDETKGIHIGRTVYDAPEIDDIVLIDGECRPSEICKIRIKDGDPYVLYGEVLEE